MSKFSAMLLDADTPAVLRKGALEELGGQLDVPRDLLTLRKQGVRTFLRVSRLDIIS